MAVIRKKQGLLLLVCIISTAHIGKVAAAPVATEEKPADPKAVDDMFPNTGGTDKPSNPYKADTPKSTQDNAEPAKVAVAPVTTQGQPPQPAQKKVPGNQDESPSVKHAPTTNATDTDSKPPPIKDPENAADLLEKDLKTAKKTSLVAATITSSPLAFNNAADETQLKARELKLPKTNSAEEKNSTTVLEGESKSNASDKQPSKLPVAATKPPPQAESQTTMDGLAGTVAPEPQLDRLEEAEENGSEYDQDAPPDTVGEQKGANEAEKVESDDEKPKVDNEKPKEEEEKLKKEEEKLKKEEEKPDKEEEKLKKEEEKPDKKVEKEPDAAEEKKPAAAEEESPRKTPKQQRKSKLPEEAADDDLSQSESSHFMFYLIVCSVLVIAAYLGVHNKKKIIGLIVEGRSTSGGRRGSRGGARYRRLDKQVNEEDAMPLKGSDRHNVIY